MGTGAAGRGRAAAVAAALILLPALASVLALRWPPVFDALLLDRDGLAQGQAWRLWSGHLLHLDATHAALNLAALLVIVAVAARQRIVPEIGVGAVAGMPVISLALMALQPTLQWYAGMSGLLHGVLVIVLLRRGGAVAAGLLLLLAFKLAWEAAAGGPWRDIAVVTLAHRLGAAWGVLWVAASGAVRSLMGPAAGNRH
ncbi:rhombosortase [Stenotrophomonas mori]|uniref:Rhombosortase n=1 Tax=Stenotrophomonas mori TaxID=2871096 RepID=A0ABT0SHB4_9GAMM|nr:rhombosortase [Stenotrophomonas mori]MCL7714705.1 rhombosortase [Stenotrophomonas mori]